MGLFILMLLNESKTNVLLFHCACLVLYHVLELMFISDLYKHTQFSFSGIYQYDLVNCLLSLGFLSSRVNTCLVARHLLLFLLVTLSQYFCFIVHITYILGFTLCHAIIEEFLVDIFRIEYLLHIFCNVWNFITPKSN